MKSAKPASFRLLRRVLFVLGVALVAPAFAEEPTLIKGKEGKGRDLPLPKPDDAFTFAVLGDRTGGPDKLVEARSNGRDQR